MAHGQRWSVRPSRPAEAARRVCARSGRRRIPHPAQRSGVPPGEQRRLLCGGSDSAGRNSARPELRLQALSARRRRRPARRRRHYLHRVAAARAPQRVPHRRGTDPTLSAANRSCHRRRRARGGSRVSRDVGAAPRPATDARTRSSVIRPRGGSVWAIVLPPLAAARLLWFGVFVAVLLLDMAGVAILPGIRTELVHWDGISFLQIAAHGYPTVLDYRDAFLPGFPLLVAGVRFVVRDYVLAAFVVNLVAEAVALWYLAKLVLGERDRASASFCVWVVALAPTALFLTAPFTEAPFMAAAAASLYYARQSRPGAAALCAAAATAFRLAGLALLPALLLEQLARGGLRRPRELALLL